ncbi:MAG: pyridoxal-dependent decarboxylase, partial [Solirubrobacteraceae bacterium]
MADRPAPVTDLAWSPEQARELGAGVLDLWTELLERLPDELVTREREPAETAAALALPVPEEPMGTPEVLAHLRELTFEQSLHMGHPAYFAYITGAGTVPGAAAEFLAAGLNQCLGGYRLGPGAAEIELHLTRWLASRFGLPEGAGGMIMTGGAMANFVGLKCARDQRLGIEVRDRGVAAAGPVAIYASEEAHVVIRRAADMLGLGGDAVRAIAVDAEQRMRVDALRAALARDVEAGVLPLAVCAT